MHTFDIMLIFSAACGVMMVGGSLALLYRGAIKLAAPRGARTANKTGGLIVKLWDKVEIATGSPVLGLFVVGLLFVALALYFALPPAVPSISFIGTTDEARGTRLVHSERVTAGGRGNVHVDVQLR